MVRGAAAEYCVFICDFSVAKWDSVGRIRFPADILIFHLQNVVFPMGTDRSFLLGDSVAWNMKLATQARLCQKLRVHGVVCFSSRHICPHEMVLKYENFIIYPYVDVCMLS